MAWLPSTGKEPNQNLDTQRTPRKTADTHPTEEGSSIPDQDNKEGRITAKEPTSIAIFANYKVTSRKNAKKGSMKTNHARMPRAVSTGPISFWWMRTVKTIQ
jgi:hypothetical protein